MKLLIAPSFRSSYQLLRTQLPQAVILTGERGVGLTSLARDLAGDRLEQVVQPTNTKGDIDTQRGTISIETIRNLYQSTRGKSSISRIVVIDSADRMTTQAQNAFLKLLEEPPEAMKFILTAHQPSHLLPTVISRLQRYQVPRLSDSQSQRLLEQCPNLTDAERKQLLFVANGRPGLLNQLANDTARRQKIVATMGLAREFIVTSSRYQRLKIATEFMSNRDQALDFVECCLSILWYQLSQSSDSGSIDLTGRLVHTHEMLLRNASPRLQLANTVLQ